VGGGGGRGEGWGWAGSLNYQHMGEAHYNFISAVDLLKANQKGWDGNPVGEKAALANFKNGVFNDGAVTVTRLHVTPGCLFYVPPGWYFARRVVSKNVAFRLPYLVKTEASLINMEASMALRIVDDDAAAATVPPGCKKTDSTRQFLEEALTALRSAKGLGTLV
jgi:hypothetical protein